MKTECNPEQLEFHALGRRDVIGRFDGGRITSDGGGLLLREVDKRIGLLDRLARCFSDYRNPNAIEHSVPALVAQRVYGLALGYEDLNDHDVLRKDSVLALLVGKQDLTGETRVRDQDRGNPLAASNTLNRLELSTPESAATIATSGSRPIPRHSTACWSMCFSNHTANRRARSGWTWMPPMIRCTATRRPFLSRLLPLLLLSSAVHLLR